MDKGYHSNELLANCASWGLRSYLPEPKRKRRKWKDKAAELEGIYRGNRRRTKGKKGRRLNRKRSEYCERTFAHVCETGGSRRSWLRGLENVGKIHSLKCAAFNLGLLMRKAFGLSKPRNWESSRATALAALISTAMAFVAALSGLMDPQTSFNAILPIVVVLLLKFLKILGWQAVDLRNPIY